jgi:hypothetical protein
METTTYLAGNFSAFHDIISSEGPRRELRQDALPAFVLDSDATKRSAMNGTPRNPDMEKSATTGSDEGLMVAFSGGSTDAFSELFSRYKQPLFGFSSGALPTTPKPKSGRKRLFLQYFAHRHATNHLRSFELISMRLA